MKNLFCTLFLIIFFSASVLAEGIAPGKMIITGFSGQTPSDPRVIKLKKMIDQGDIGGIILFKRNISTKKQLTSLVSYLTKDTPIFVAIDHEGGIVNRLTHSSFNLKTPSPQRFCTLDKTTQTNYANKIAKTLEEIGINMNLGGVVDIAPLVHPSSICRYRRCFGDNNASVTECNQVLFDAHNNANIYFALKHFPGHGSTPIDSHYYLPDITKHHSNYDYMPYHGLIKDNDSPYIIVMVGHLMDKSVDDKLPASLSNQHLRVLKESLNFKGLIITDDLNMGALYKVSKDKVEIAKKAVLAGNDLLLYEFLSFDDINAINQALQQDATISKQIQDNIQHSLLKIQDNLSLNVR